MWTCGSLWLVLWLSLADYVQIQNPAAYFYVFICVSKVNFWWKNGWLSFLGPGMTAHSCRAGPRLLAGLGEQGWDRETVSPHTGAPSGRGPRLRGSKLHAAPRPGGHVFRGLLWGSKGERVRTDVMEALLGSLALLLENGVCAAGICWLGEPGLLSLPPCLPWFPILTPHPEAIVWGPRGLEPPTLEGPFSCLPSPSPEPWAKAHSLQDPPLPRSRCPTEPCSFCSLGMAFPPQMGSWS